jgi:hypothetical protein
VVAPQGFEPRYAAPEAAVLPLNEGATSADLARLAAGLALGLGRTPGVTNRLDHHKGIPAHGQTCWLECIQLHTLVQSPA